MVLWDCTVVSCMTLMGSSNCYQMKPFFFFKSAKDYQLKIFYICSGNKLKFVTFILFHQCIQVFINKTDLRFTFYKNDSFKKNSSKSTSQLRVQFFVKVRKIVSKFQEKNNY